MMSRSFNQEASFRFEQYPPQMAIILIGQMNHIPIIITLDACDSCSIHGIGLSVIYIRTEGEAAYV